MYVSYVTSLFRSHVAAPFPMSSYSVIFFPDHMLLGHPCNWSHLIKEQLSDMTACTEPVEPTEHSKSVTSRNAFKPLQQRPIN